MLDPATRERLERSLRALETDRIANLPLLLGVVASVGLHAALLVPRIAGILSESHDGVDRTRQAAFSVEKEMEKHPAPADNPEDHLTLGIEDGTTDSTMTWIGYNEYQEHIAQLSKVDQAAFRDTDQGGAPAPASVTAPPVPQQVAQPSPEAPPQMEPRPPQPPETPPPSAQPPQRQPAPPQEQPSESQEPPQPQAPPAAPPPRTAATLETPAAPSAIPIPAAKETQIEPMLQPVDRAPDQPEAEAPKPEDPGATAPPARETAPQRPAPPADQPPAQPTSQPPQPRQPASAQPSPPAQANPGPPQPAASPAKQVPPSPQPPGAKPGPRTQGELSDRESDATSTITARPDQWKMGRPLAAKGLRVLTKRPYFDELTSVTTAPRAPLAQIEFDRTGKAVNCTLLESSGFPSVDQPILDSLYGWRAQGKELEKLKPGETAKFRIRLLLR